MISWDARLSIPVRMAFPCGPHVAALLLALPLSPARPDRPRQGRLLDRVTDAEVHGRGCGSLMPRLRGPLPVAVCCRACAAYGRAKCGRWLRQAP
jgi:hypothetical protein